MTNERFEQLVQQSVILRDVSATEELERYFLSMIEPKVRRACVEFGTCCEDELVTSLLDKAHSAAIQLLVKPIEKPRNYVIRAISNKYVEELRKLKRRYTREQAFDPSVSGRLVVLDDTFENLVALSTLDSLRHQSFNTTAKKVLQVIEVTFALSVTETEACRLLNFGEQEAETVLRTLRRWRSSDTSPIQRLRVDGRDDV